MEEEEEDKTVVGNWETIKRNFPLLKPQRIKERVFREKVGLKPVAWRS